MLQIKHLTVTHKKDLGTILKDFSFTLNDGDKAVLIGEEGDGKSTLLKLICDPALIDSYAEYTGEIIKKGLRLGYLAQELSAQEQRQTALNFCAAGKYLLTPAEMSGVSSELGIETALFFSARQMRTLSGGEKVKLQLARLMMERPDILLLDEPSNDLDIAALEWLENFINTCGKPVLFVSHDETLIENTANVIIHLEKVRHKTMPRHTVSRIKYRQYVEERAARLAHQGKVANKQQEEYEKQQEKFRRIKSRVEHEQAAVSRSDPHGGRMLKKKMKAVKSQERRFYKERERKTEMPDTEDAVEIRFDPDTLIPAGKTVLDLSLPCLSVEGKTLARNISLRVKGPEKLVIVGKNGIGKSTLLKAVASELLIRRDIKAGYMPQDYSDGINTLQTPVEFLSTVGDKAEITKIRTFLGSVKFTSDEMEHAFYGLSGGQKAKLLLLRLLYRGCNVLVLDEPTRNLSPLSGPVIRSALREFKGSVISVSHDRKYIGEVCGTVLRLTESGLEPLG